MKKLALVLVLLVLVLVGCRGQESKPLTITGDLYVVKVPYPNPQFDQSSFCGLIGKVIKIEFNTDYGVQEIKGKVENIREESLSINIKSWDWYSILYKEIISFEVIK